MKEQTDMLLFTLAVRSGMGRFASEMARTAARVWPGEVILAAPAMENEPGLPRRVVFDGPLLQGSRMKRLWRLFTMNLIGAAKVWCHAKRGQVFLMIDLFPTVPFSILPVLAARARGAICVLNMHDFYPHARRYPRWMKSFELACYRFAYRRFDLIAAMKPAQVPRLSYEAGVSADRVVVIEHGAFPVEGIVPPQSDDPIRVLILGSLRENKRVLDSVEAVRLLRAEGRDIRLRIAGAPRREEPAYWAKCKSALTAFQRTEPEALELTARYISDDEMPRILSGVDAMLCPYEGFDSQSGISITAVSNGIPLIASAAARVEGCDPFVEVARPVTPTTIAAAIAELSDRPRPEQQAQARIMQARFEARSLWSAAIHTIAAGLGIGLHASTKKEE